MSDYAWDSYNTAALEQSRELDWQEREHVRHVQARELDRFRDRAGMGEAKPDPRPKRRVKLTWKQWAAVRDDMGEPVSQLSGHVAHSVHHIVPRSLGGDDVPENLMWVTGDGTRGEHGLIEARDPKTLELVRTSLRPAQLEYVIGKIGEDRFRRLYPLLSERRAA